MPLDPEIQPIVDLINSLDAPPAAEQDIGEMRDAFELVVAGLGAGPESVRTEDLAATGPSGEVPVRVFRSDRPTDAEGASPRGVVVYFHGGGWVYGSIRSSDALCRELAERTGCTIVSVGYRLAPEDRFPAALQDCEAALRWVVAQSAELGVDPSRLALAGDSAGGQLAAVLSRRCRDAGVLDVAIQVLIYPVTDLSIYPLGPECAHRSLVENATGYLLTTETMEFFADTYVPDVDVRLGPDASPLLQPDLTGLAPAVVITAEFDPLRDEGEAYAERLADAGVPTVCTRYDGATHLFVQMNGTAIAKRAIDEIGEALRARLR